MSKKYICMKEDCPFCALDEEDAYEHAHMGRGHYVVEVDMDEGKNPICHLIGLPYEVGNNLEEEEV